MSITLAKLGDLVPGAFTDIIMLHAYIATDNNVSHLRIPFSTSGYQVTAGKSLFVAKFQERGTGIPGWWKFGYADNDVGFNTSTARTNPVMTIGVDDENANGFNTSRTNSNNESFVPPSEFLWKISISAKFPFVRRFGASSNNELFLWCFEV